MPEIPTAKTLHHDPPNRPPTPPSQHQTTATCQIENRSYITKSHFNPSGNSLSALLVPILATQEAARASELENNTKSTTIIPPNPAELAVVEFDNHDKTHR